MNAPSASGQEFKSYQGNVVFKVTKQTPPTFIVHTHDDGVGQISVLEGRRLVEHYVSRPTDDATTIDGNIYLGRVQNVLPGHTQWAAVRNVRHPIKVPLQSCQ